MSATEHRGYFLKHKPKPLDYQELQRIRDTVDPKVLQQRARRWDRLATVRALLQHIDYLQLELDAVMGAEIDYFGEDHDPVD